jgi:hypothetical protein
VGCIIGIIARLLDSSNVLELTFHRGMILFGLAFFPALAFPSLIQFIKIRLFPIHLTDQLAY